MAAAIFITANFSSSFICGKLIKSSIFLPANFCRVLVSSSWIADDCKDSGISKSKLLRTDKPICTAFSS